MPYDIKVTPNASQTPANQFIYDQWRLAGYPDKYDGLVQALISSNHTKQSGASDWNRDDIKCRVMQYRVWIAVQRGHQVPQAWLEDVGGGLERWLDKQILLASGNELTQLRAFRTRVHGGGVLTQAEIRTLFGNRLTAAGVHINPLAPAAAAPAAAPALTIGAPMAPPLPPPPPPVAVQAVVAPAPVPAPATITAPAPSAVNSTNAANATAATPAPPSAPAQLEIPDSDEEQEEDFDDELEEQPGQENLNNGPEEGIEPEVDEQPEDEDDLESEQEDESQFELLGDDDIVDEVNEDEEPNREAKPDLEPPNDAHLINEAPTQSIHQPATNLPGLPDVRGTHMWPPKIGTEPFNQDDPWPSRRNTIEPPTPPPASTGEARSLSLPNMDTFEISSGAPDQKGLLVDQPGLDFGGLGEELKDLEEDLFLSQVGEEEVKDEEM